jgi:hypothetical protein
MSNDKERKKLSGKVDNVNGINLTNQNINKKCSIRKNSFFIDFLTLIILKFNKNILSFYF